MHEMSYCIRLVNMACENVDIENEKVTELSIKIGAMTGIVPDYLVKYFPEAAAGTAAADATLDIESIPVSGECTDCGLTYEPNAGNDYRCPHCKSLKFDLKHGREFELVSIKAAPLQNS